MKKESIYRELFKLSKNKGQRYIDFLDKNFNSWKKAIGSLPSHVNDCLKKSKTEDEFIKNLEDRGMDESILKTYFNKRLQEEHIPDEATLISIVKNPYPGKFVTEVSYDDAVKLLKDEYGYDDDKIEAIKAEVAKNEEKESENYDEIANKIIKHAIDNNKKGSNGMFYADKIITHKIFKNSTKEFDDLATDNKFLKSSNKKLLRIGLNNGFIVVLKINTDTNYFYWHTITDGVYDPADTQVMKNEIEQYKK